MAYINQLSPIASSLGSFQLDGSYTSLEDMPNSLRKLIKRSKKIILVRETTQQSSIKFKKDTGAKYNKGGGRTTGTMWYKGNILGFTVEDAIRDKKIQDVTAIPDTVKDPTKLTSLEPSSYNIVLGATGSPFISKTHYKGQGLRVSSLSDPTGTNIFTEDVNAELGFQNKTRDGKELAFDGVMIHHGGSENSSSGCIIFGTKRKDDGKVSSSAKEIQALNKYLQEQGVIGKGKLNNLVIVNLDDVPKDIPNLLGEIIDAETGRPIPGTEVYIEPLPLLNPEDIDLTNEAEAFGEDIKENIPTQEDLKGKGKEKLSKISKKLKKNPLSAENLSNFSSQIFSFIKS